jgi:hypothetical protein
MLSDVSQVQKDRLLVFSHIWKIDPKGKCIRKNKHDHTHLYREPVCTRDYSKELRGGGRGKGNESTVSKRIASCR